MTILNKGAILLTLILLVFVGCTEDDELNPTSNYTVEYQNQTLQGKINGVDWIAVSGTATSSGLGVDTFSHLLSIVDTTVDTLCFVSGGASRSRVLFGYQDENQIVVPGEKTLKLDFGSTTENFTVTLVFQDDQGTPQNLIATKGAYEILSVDTVSRMITGRMDVKYDDNSFVNGNFTIRYCNWD